MLSAVAARKAALSAHAERVNESPTPSGSGANTPTPAPTRSVRGNETPKRKSSSQKSRPSVKKPKKVEHAAKGKDVLKDSRMVDSFRDQTDIIVVDSDDEDSDSEMSGLQEEFLLGGSGSGSVTKSYTKRAWSPSQPLEDSSDEDELPADAEVGNPLDISSLFPHLSRPPQTQSIDDGVLSTFSPELDQNLFLLTAEESRVFGLSEKATIIGLNPDDTICVLGTCTLTILHGSVYVLGATLSSSIVSYPIYAPRSSPLPVLRAGEGSSSSSLLPDVIPHRLQKILQYKAVVALQELKTGVDGLGRICRTFEGVFDPSRWQKSSIEAPFDVSGLYLVRKQAKECTPFSLPSSWSATLEAVTHDDKVLSGAYIVKGPKNSGKSSFARTLTNHLLRRYRKVAFLECDLGQSEFTPGGMVTLNVISSPILGPPFTHPTLPNRAHYIGSTTPRSSPSHYIDAIHALIQTYRLDIQTPSPEMDMDVDSDDDSRIADVIPIVVNTMGWSKGLGADLTQRIESMLEPTDIFDIQPPVREEYPVSVAPIPTPATYGAQYGAYHLRSTMSTTTARIHTLDNVLSAPSALAMAYTPADHRALAILSYFHARFPPPHSPSPSPPLGLLQQITAVSWDTTKPLCAELPYSVECGVAFDKVVLTGAGSEDVVEEEIGRVLNGAIVGLVSCEPGTLAFEAVDGEETGKCSDSIGIPYTRHLTPPLPLSSTCVGIALVRGVSPPIPVPPEESPGQRRPGVKMRTYLQLLTPLPQTLFVSSRVLVKGEMELPVWGMLDFRNFDDKEDKGVDMGDVAGVDRENVPFLQWGKAPDGALGAEKRRVRRNLMRRGQM